MKAIHEHFRCDLCGRFSNFGVTESYALPHVPGEGAEMLAQNTVCVRCISNGTALMLEGLCNAAADDEEPTSTAGSSSA